MFRRRSRFCLSTPLSLLTRYSQEEPFDLSQKPPGLPSLCFSQSDGESVPGSSCQDEDEDESFYRRSQYSPEVYQHEPTGEDQYTPELEEGEDGGQGYPPKLRPDKAEEQGHRREAGEQPYHPGDQAYKSEPGGHRRDPMANQGCFSQPGETPEQVYDSDSELGDQVFHRELGDRQIYDSDSDLGDPIYQQEMEELEAGDQDDYSESGVNMNQSDVEERGNRLEEERESRVEPDVRVHHSLPGEVVEATEAHAEEEVEKDSGMVGDH